jgi:hypothetical protein
MMILKNEFPEISEEDAMAYKLGIITLCFSCKQRIDLINNVWIHEKTGRYYCSKAYRDYPLYAKPEFYKDR